MPPVPPNACWCAAPWPWWPLVKVSKGHDICAGADAWVNGVNTDLMRALAFHPFAEEQQAVADLIMKKLDVE